MSIQHVSLVLDCRDEQLSSARRMVLIALANRADADDICWPRQELIAQETGMSVRSLQDHLTALVTMGYLERATHARGQGKGSKTVYRLITDRLRGAKSAPANDEFRDARFAPAKFGDAESCGLDTRNTASQEPTVEPTVDDDDTRERVKTIRTLCEPVMVSPARSPSVAVLIEPTEWAKRSDFDTFVLPVLCGVVERHRGPPIRSWGYFGRALADEADRMRSATVIPIGEAPRRETPTDDYQARLMEKMRAITT